VAEELQVAQRREVATSLSNFDYDLPKDLIAQAPLVERDRARMLVLCRQTGEIQHRTVRALPELLSPGDLLVLNNTRVLPARLYGVREQTGGKWEGLFLRQARDALWELMCQTRGRLRAGEWMRIDSGDACLRLRLMEKTSEGHWLVAPDVTLSHTRLGSPGESRLGSPMELLERFGHVPLPPYIRKGVDQPVDRERYQTVFAERAGAVAAPTAGLHFTPELFTRLDQRGIQRAFVTLHVGAGTFRRIEVENIAEHRLHSEWAELPAATAASIAACNAHGGRVVAVGTTTVRTLETVAREPGFGELGKSTSWSGESDLYIYPPFQFQVVGALVTNFHLPRSSLLVLVSAFAGIDLIRRAYEVAIAERYRFYSYGDAMLIL
jgi:S-adenosylmethionine:tRNA ribosyltransferase-isomerase